MSSRPTASLRPCLQQGLRGLTTPARSSADPRLCDGQQRCGGPRVVCEADGQPLTQKVIQGMMRRVARRANAKPGVHILRHTFCSHLAMRGAPARAIQELAGHQDLDTTQRYMHLSPAALDVAIRLLETGTESRGEILEAAGNRP